MPKCAVRSCKNSSNNIRIRDGVSFFHFPGDLELAERWSSILSPVVSHSFKQRTAVVCSDHFSRSDKYMCKKRHRLTKNAVPDPNLLGPWRRPDTMPPVPPQDLVDSDSSDEESAMVVDVPDILRPPSECTVCRLCLLSEGNMECVSDELADTYHQVTGIKWDKHDTLPQHACWECAARVRGAGTLRRRALAAHSLLRDVASARGALTLNDILSIDRSYHYLTSNLSQKDFPPNQYLTKTINNNQIFTKDTKGCESNIDLTLKIDKNTIIENDNIAGIGNNDNNADNLTTEEYSIETDLKRDNMQENESKTENGDHKSVNNYFNNDVDADSSRSNVEDSMREADDEGRSDYLVIDAEEPIETVIRSEYVSRTDGGMPIDELIDIYNNDGDGDGRLQELNEQFEGATVQVDQGWGGYRAGGGVADTRPPPPPPDPDRQPLTLKRSNSRPKRSGLKSKPRHQQTRDEYCKSKCYEKMDQELFTITPVTDEEQIAEILKRQETYRYKHASFKCNLCYRSFASRRPHAAHMRRHDAINGDYECHICKSRQKSPRAMKTHIFGQHTVRISCNQCGFVTMNRRVARTHGKWHAGTVYQCRYCPEHFDLESPYKVHLRTQHAHAHACGACGRTFHSGKGLAVHRVRLHGGHHTIPSVGPYCETCSVGFATEEAHARHLTMSSRHRSDNQPHFIGPRVAELPELNTAQPNAAAVSY